MYNPKYYKDGKMCMQRGKHPVAIHTFKTADGTLIGMFQGNRGDKPDLDFQVKYLNIGSDARPVLLPHVDWIVDVLLKAQKFPVEMKEIIEYYIHFYETCTPFASKEERANYTPSSLSDIENKYSQIIVPGTLSIGGIAIILELFCLCEKQNANAHQFKYSLIWIKECLEGKKNYRNLLNLVTKHREY